MKALVAIILLALTTTLAGCGLLSTKDRIEVMKTCEELGGNYTENIAPFTFSTYGKCSIPGEDSD